MTKCLPGVMGEVERVQLQRESIKEFYELMELFGYLDTDCDDSYEKIYTC